MILASVAGVVLAAALATNPFDESTANLGPSAQDKAATMTQPLVRLATDCIVHAVVADPRYSKGPASELGDLIVDSMPACLTPVRAMIDAYDRYYGDGSGEAFFMGPYLDVLPKVVADAARQQQAK